MKCIRIRFILPSHSPIEFEGKKVIILKIQNQDIVFDVEIIDNKIYNLYSLKSKPLGFEIKDSTIKAINDSLYLSSFDTKNGILLNSKLASGGISNAFKNELSLKFGIKKQSDFVGVKVLDCETKIISVTASMSVGLRSSIFETSVNSKIKEYSSLDKKLLRAIELYNSTSYLTRMNNSGRFILLMSAIECIIIQKERANEIIEILDKAKENISNLLIDKQEMKSVLSSIDFIKRNSIKKGGKLTIEELFLGSKEKYNGFTPVDFFDKAYNLRSKLVHNGITKTKFLTIENAELQQFTMECLKRYYEKFHQNKSN